MLSWVLSRHRRLAAAAAVALLAAADAASAQITLQLGRGGIGVGPGYGYGNPYRGSGYNPYLGGAYTRGGRNDWYYDRYQPRRFGGGVGVGPERHGVPNWGTYRNPNLYGPGGPYSGYGYDQHGHLR
jgi:hypothetical protein